MIGGRQEGEPITATHIERAAAILRDPSHPEYPQWAKDRDARLKQVEDDFLAHLVAHVLRMVSP